VPCTRADSACTEWIGLNGVPQRLLVYRSYALGMHNEGITGALIIFHGGGRNPADSFNTALAAAFLAKALENTVLVAPRFAATSGISSSGGTPCGDTIATDEARWVCEDQDRDSWRSGGSAIGNEGITSYDFVDEIVRKVASRATFPNLRGNIMAGHSGGGQLTLRYAMANQVQDRVDIPISYVVSNPDALVYLDNLRPTTAAYPANAARPGYVTAGESTAFVSFPDARNCATYNDWQYGLQKRSGYAARLTEQQLARQLRERSVTYLLGGLDILPIAGFDGSCPAMAQGPTRLARGIAFNTYVNEKHGAHHRTVVLPVCGHNDRCMFTANPALQLLFPGDR
jgi:hypothetical protein